jgi:succinate dehydrogenase / fumarate reductase cytochrome b subunit
VLLLGWTFAFFYHLGNGIRHLVWDAGKGFEKSQIELGGMIVIFAALILTAVYAFLVIF